VLFRRHHHHRPGGHVLDPDPAKSVAAGQIDPTRFTTRRFPLQEAIQAYDTFARAGETNALKVLLTIEG
jgi:alcohol dehydrogenase